MSGCVIAMELCQLPACPRSGRSCLISSTKATQNHLVEESLVICDLRHPWRYHNLLRILHPWHHLVLTWANMIVFLNVEDLTGVLHSPLHLRHLEVFSTPFVFMGAILLFGCLIESC
ncbi:hypothetical protein AVEN_78626-1 [Araneus ventricosus]|uniref:Uncharacterized protein n=1 Tax=Araneus ventricosus TaxID=182803 RepID=A0A4Y2V0J3_ARAVE|nr:hypothetical protein AVEN_78626-1 [Araneus ventricosus]